MAMICYERTDALHAHGARIRSIQVVDGVSLCGYLKGFWEFIYHHKMFGCTYDIYADNIEVIRENGIVLRGIPAVKQDLLNVSAAFPDLQVKIEAIFTMPKGDAYEVWMRYYFTGTNSSYSVYGAPSGLRMEGDKGLNLSLFYAEKIDDEWLITAEKTGRPCDYIRAVCTGDDSFTHVKL